MSGPAIIEHRAGRVSAPGIYAMPAALYHSDPCPEPSLSASLAKIILAKTPKHAAAAHPRLPGRVKNRDDSKFNLGTTTHEMILGAGGGFVVVEADSWAAKAAKLAREEIEARGKTAILLKDFDRADYMAEAVRENLAQSPDTAKIFDAAHGRPELVLIWQEANGIWCRSMMDWVWRDWSEIDDLKTTGVDLGDLGRQIANMGYDVQEGFYRRGLEKIVPDVAGRIRFRFVFAEADLPHETIVVENDATGREMGRRKAEHAVKLFGKHLSVGEWPGYPRAVQSVAFPIWAEKAWMEREMVDPEFV